MTIESVGVGTGTRFDADGKIGICLSLDDGRCDVFFVNGSWSNHSFLCVFLGSVAIMRGWYRLVKRKIHLCRSHLVRCMV